MIRTQLDRLKASAREKSEQRAAHLASLQEHRSNILRGPRYADDRRLLKYGFSVYSQGDEDGILQEIFRRIGPGNRTFLEIGAGYGVENNTLFLAMQGWRGAWIEASARRITFARNTILPLLPDKQLKVEQHRLTRDNADEIVRRLAPSPQLDLLSIDIDGNDLHVLRAIQSISPRVIVAEYNAKFPGDTVWVMEYNEAHQWDGTDYFGASLKAYDTLLSERGYSLVGCNLLGTNAFFVRGELVRDPPFCSPFTAENHYEPPRYYLRAAFAPALPVKFGPFRTDCGA
jgi:hypothetical protein